MDALISSVIPGYEHYRVAVAEAVETLGHRVIRAEDLAAEPGAPQQACLEAVRRSDIVVLLLGADYGAASHGEAVGRYAAALLATPLPWTRMRTVYRLLGRVRKWGPDRVNDACARALEAEAVEVGLITRMLERATRNPRQRAGTARHRHPRRFARDPGEFAVNRGGGAMTATPAALTPELRQVLRRLKLGKMLDTLPERLTLAKQSNLSHAAFLCAFAFDLWTIVIRGLLNVLMGFPLKEWRQRIRGRNCNTVQRSDAWGLMAPWSWGTIVRWRPVYGFPRVPGPRTGSERCVAGSSGKLVRFGLARTLSMFVLARTTLPAGHVGIHGSASRTKMDK